MRGRKREDFNKRRPRARAPGRRNQEPWSCVETRQRQGVNQIMMDPEARLEKQLQSILNNAPGEVTVKFPKITVIHIVVRDGLLRVVPEIERFYPDLCPEVFGQGSRLEQRQISIPNSRPVEAVSGQTAVPNNGARRVCRQHS